MPLGGPRPNPTASRPVPSQPPNTYITIQPNDSNPSINGPAFPSDPPSSQLPYPHQSSLQSGTTLLEPTSRRDPGQAEPLTAQRIRDEWVRNREGYGGREELYERDIGSGNLYSDPYSYQEHEGDYGTDGSVRATSVSRSSLGPWDSASQRQRQPSNPSFPAPNWIPNHTIPLNDTQPQPHSSSAMNHVKQKPSYAGGLSYIDEEGLYYKSDSPRPASAMANQDHDLEMRGLVGSAAGMGMRNTEEEEEPYRVKFQEFEQSPHPYPAASSPNSIVSRDGWWTPLLFPTGMDRVLGLCGVKGAKEPVEQAIERKRRGLGGQKWPVAAWGLAAGEYLSM
jgi:hypothetical protein